MSRDNGGRRGLSHSGTASECADNVSSVRRFYKGLRGLGRRASMQTDKLPFPAGAPLIFSFLAILGDHLAQIKRLCCPFRGGYFRRVCFLSTMAGNYKCSSTKKCADRSSQLIISSVPKSISDERIGSLFKSLGALKVRRINKGTMVFSLLWDSRRQIS